MNRSLLLRCLRGLGMALALLTASLGVALAQPVRQFPQGTQAGTLVVSTPPEATIDGKALRLAPGVRIQGPDNMQVMSAALVGRSFVVAYLRDAYGLVSRIWLLNEAEIDAVRESLAPVINFSFGSSQPATKVDDGKTPYDQLPRFPRKP